MPLRLDWKFFLTLVFTIASVVVPIWLWQADLSSKALTLAVKSTAELQPQGADLLEGVQVLIDGRPLSSPYVSVLELSNSGSKPILPSDFEGPLRISTSAPSKIVKARTTSPSPASLEPSLSLSEGTVLLQPLLLNPGDLVRFTLVTANARPVYNARARVAGVPEVVLIDTQAGRETKRYWLGRVVSTLLIVVYMLNIAESAIAGLRRRIFLPWSLATAVISMFGAALIEVMLSTGDPAAMSSLFPIMAVAAVLVLCLLAIRKNPGVA